MMLQIKRDVLSTSCSVEHDTEYIILTFDGNLFARNVTKSVGMACL